MDFARKQLEKYGWSDGKGLGKHENGISEALKPKLKRSVAGVGHDPAAEFNEHWWTALYDKAAGNVEVQDKNGKTKKIQTKDEQEFVITNSTWKLKKKQKSPENDEQYNEYFVRTEVLTNGANKVERVRESESEDEGDRKDVFKMTDEELFAACEGRTAHKGARHGLKATGKLARIAQQEALLLSQSKYNGYSHAKKLKDKVVEEMNLNSDPEVTEHKKKKKKRKRCNSNEKRGENNECDMAESNEIPFPDKSEVTYDESATSVIKEKKIRKSKKSTKIDFRDIEEIPEEDEDVSKPKIQKNDEDEISEPMETYNEEETLFSEKINKKSKTKKKKLLNYNL